MTRGFYNLTSGLLSQNRRLDVVSNNITNLASYGYKSETYTDRPFDEVLISRIGNKDKTGSTVIGQQANILAPDQLYFDLSQGSIKETGLPLDFAIEGDGFFAINTGDGIRYTRNGSFSLNDEGQISLAGQGLVLGADGEPISLFTDRIEVDTQGRIFTQDGGYYMGQLGVYTFEDNALLEKDESGLFDPVGQQATATNDPQILWRQVEESNVDILREMTRLITAQRTLQGGAQILQLYDSLLTKATSELGRL